MWSRVLLHMTAEPRVLQRLLKPMQTAVELWDAKAVQHEFSEEKDAIA